MYTVYIYKVIKIITISYRVLEKKRERYEMRYSVQKRERETEREENDFDTVLSIQNTLLSSVYLYLFSSLLKPEKY